MGTDDTRTSSQPAVNMLSSPIQIEDGKEKGKDSCQIMEGGNTLGKVIGTSKSNPRELNSLHKWDNTAKLGQELRYEQEACDKQKVTRTKLVKELFRENEDAQSVVEEKNGPDVEELEVSSPLKLGTKTSINGYIREHGLGPENEKKPVNKGKWKKNS